MRKKIVITLIFFGILIAGFFVYLRNTPNSSKSQTQLTPVQVSSEKSQQQQTVTKEELCSKDEDCAIASNLPNRKGACVNKVWLDEWNKNPESEKYARDCIVGPVCSGRDFVLGGMRMPKNNGCQCINNRCQVSDLKDYPGCQMVGCD